MPPFLSTISLPFFLLLLPALPRPALPQPTFRDVNLLIVTDVHGWIASHAHPDRSPPSNANFADVADAVLHAKLAASSVGRDVFFVNDGDHTQGSGVSDATAYTAGVHGSELFPILRKMPFDALTIGNHELYLDSTVRFMRESGGFVDSWNGKYVTSNVLDAATSDPLGSRYAVLIGPNSGIKLLVFGFLYHVKDGCPSVVVEDPEIVSSSSSGWFVEALESNADVDAVIVLAHADLVDPSVYAIRRGIRNVLPRTPVQFVTGHTHRRGFKKLDGRTSTFEAGHFADTLGWLSFDLVDKDDDSDVSFEHRFVDVNVEALRNFTGVVSSDEFRTEVGNEIESAIDAAIDKLDLDRVLGCPSRTYSNAAVLDAPDSLHMVYVSSIVPTCLFDVPTGTGNEPYHVASVGGLRYSVYEGEFTYGDVFAVAPFSSRFRYYPALRGDRVVSLMEHLDDVADREDDFLSSRALRWSPKLPPYVAGPGEPRSDAVYDVFFDEFDARRVIKGIAKILHRDVKEVKASVVRWRDDLKREDYVDTTLCWVEAVPKLWPCDDRTDEDDEKNEEVAASPGGLRPIPALSVARLRRSST